MISISRGPGAIPRRVSPAARLRHNGAQVRPINAASLARTSPNTESGTTWPTGKVNNVVKPMPGRFTADGGKQASNGLGLYICRRPPPSDSTD